MANKEYIHPAEERQERHEKEQKNKKKKKKFAGLLVLVLLIAALILLMNYLGLGFGGGKGSGDSGKSETSSSAKADASSEETSSEVEKMVVTVKISGSTYIYGDRVYTIDEFKDNIAAPMNKDTVVIELLDDNAVANAVENMHSMLDELGISYVDKVFEDTSSDSADDSQQSAQP